MSKSSECFNDYTCHYSIPNKKKLNMRNGRGWRRIRARQRRAFITVKPFHLLIKETVND